MARGTCRARLTSESMVLKHGRSPLPGECIRESADPGHECALEAAAVRAGRETLLLDQLRRAREVLTLARDTAGRLEEAKYLERVQAAMRCINGDEDGQLVRVPVARTDSRRSVKRALSQLHDARRAIDDTPGPIPAETLDDIRSCVYAALGELEGVVDL